MSALSQFGGVRPTAVIHNGFSSGSPLGQALAGGSGVVTGHKAVTSGALTANTLASQFTVTGAGEMASLTVCSADATSRTIRLQVIVDGVTVFDATSAAIAAGGGGIAAAGLLNSIYCGAPIRFNTSLTVNACSSITETGKLVTNYTLQTF